VDEVNEQSVYFAASFIRHQRISRSKTAGFPSSLNVEPHEGSVSTDLFTGRYCATPERTHQASQLIKESSAKTERSDLATKYIDFTRNSVPNEATSVRQ